MIKTALYLLGFKLVLTLLVIAFIRHQRRQATSMMPALAYSDSHTAAPRLAMR